MSLSLEQPNTALQRTGGRVLVKAYIDQVVRVGRTFTFEDGQFKGLASGRKVLFIRAVGK
ncbi:NAD(P)H-dependent oxidoreductase [Chroococcidiopsis sp. CCMEE 29]|uniref:NAD(P)H-dependent oxidoreductase n=1 Tax=Chroococcidiopsis sp. CCMEE 29 TaxID=155894 RepID=UPI00202193CC|nr:NAD(P)H-dependent oxidoreductase [Chroococcidiopsis sp. CCMEE 29]